MKQEAASQKSEREKAQLLCFFLSFFFFLKVNTHLATFRATKPVPVSVTASCQDWTGWAQKTVLCAEAIGNSQHLELPPWGQWTAGTQQSHRVCTHAEEHS